MADNTSAVDRRNFIALPWSTLLSRYLTARYSESAVLRASSYALDSCSPKGLWYGRGGAKAVWQKFVVRCRGSEDCLLDEAVE